MTIFTDMHHGSLFTSLQYLFEDRLGYTLYRPIGEEWFTQGYWKLAEPYNNNSATVTQYLGIRDVKYDPYKNLNEIKDARDECYVIQNEIKDQKAITLDQFKRMDIDIIIASYYPHIDPYRKLIANFKPNAKLIYQVGNEWPKDFVNVKNILASVLPFEVPGGINAVFYHQEFDTNLFCYEDPLQTRIIRSFVNCLSSTDQFRKDWEDFIMLEKFLNDYTFESHGASCRNGTVREQQNIARKMKEAMWGIHLKTGGDGYGHVLHNWFASGRPVIYRSSQYEGKLGGLLLEDMVTGIDLDKHSLAETAIILRELSWLDYSNICRNVYARFKSIVDFDKEENNIRQFITNLL
ncbi:MAG TPA: hypothetical protein ACFYD4_06170 [Candidatus Wunengus sp. YC61]|uniref:hypothetical protein n=1 Tax=Candidatus Wunengus sp. YC61 TaxID=3367698 RepID=UPI004028C844